MAGIDFNPLKILKYDTQLQQIKNGQVPDPVMLEIDPCNYCNFGCSWCSSGHHLWEQQTPKNMITLTDFECILEFVREKSSIQGMYFVGGGEPTLNPNLPKFMRLSKELGINNYITNNGSNLNRMYKDLIDLCRWVAVSVNSGTEEKWREVFKTKMDYNQYLDGLRKLNDYNHSSGRNIETTFKHTFDTSTYVDIVKAYVQAIDLGFTNVLIKPVDLFIYKRHEKRIPFNEVWNENVVKQVNENIEFIKRLNKDNPIIKLDCGGFYGSTFEVDKSVIDHTNICWTNPMAPVFGADGNIHICCVRRSEKIVGKWNDGNLIKYWGSEEHKKAVWGFNPNSECPARCKMRSYNHVCQDVYIDNNFSLGHI